MSANKANLDALLRGLREVGYIEGQNLIIDYRSAEGRADRFSELAKELVRAKPDVIVTRGTAAALAARDAASIPIVMVSSANPVGAGLVSNLSRPGGNITGLTSLVTEAHGKRLELLKELLPGIKRVGAVLNPVNPNSRTQVKNLQQAGRSLGVEVRVFEASGDAQTLKRALEEAASQAVGALVINAEVLVIANQRAIVEFAAKRNLPVMYSSPEFVDAGGLISYGVHYSHLYYRTANYIAKILKGTKPGDLPVEQPTKFELVVNLRTARTIGIAVPQSILLRADRLIERPN